MNSEQLHLNAGMLAIPAMGAASYALLTTFSKMAFLEGISIEWQLVTRSIFWISVLSIIMPILKVRFTIERNKLKPVSLFIASSIMLFVCYMSSFTLIPVPVAAVVFYTGPFIVQIASPFVDGTPLRLHRVVASLVAALGLALLLGFSTDDLNLFGVALAFMAAVAMAAQHFSGRRVGRNVNTLTSIYWVQVFGLLPVITILSLSNQEQNIVKAFEPVTWVAITLMVGGWICQLMGTSLQLLSLRRIPPAINSIIFCLEPVITSVAIALLVHEVLEPEQYLGGLITVSALAISIWRDYSLSKKGVKLGIELVQ